MLPGEQDPFGTRLPEARRFYYIRFVRNCNDRLGRTKCTAGPSGRSGNEHGVAEGKEPVALLDRGPVGVENILPAGQR